jgi:hypothetical protein
LTSIPKRGETNRRTIAKEGLGDAKGDKGKEKTEKGK